MAETEKWNRMKDIFAECVELPFGERNAFLAKSCGEDADLRREIDSLLAAHDEENNLLELNSLDLGERLSDTESVMTERRFGRYRIVREIGSGGMGSVFLAERDDGEFSMQVALKIVRQSIASREVIERFKSERQILANLHHTNIATLIDGGVSDKGEPFLAMEFVDGVSITEYCELHDLNVKERLRLFLKVCSAVAFAHRNLVVHRDLKPSNILVDTDGQPKLLDFGLAKAFSDDSAQTQTAFRAFTPAYASPEQIIGRNISTASDQYSLGVILYELLTGSKPFNFDGYSYEEIVRSLDSVSVKTPSSTVLVAKRGQSSLASDLDNIALKALRREPERRYSSVEAFADDIRRFLEGRPVSARPNTFGYLASRFVKRYKTPVAAAALILVALIGGLAAAVWQARIAGQERDKAERRFQEVRGLSTSLLFEIAPRIERLEGSTETRQVLVTRALEYLNTLAAEKENDPTLQAELAQAYQKIGDLQGNTSKPNLGDYIGAVESLEKARSILLTLPGSTEIQLRLAEVSHELAKIKFTQGQTQASIAESENASLIYTNLLSADPTSAEIRKLLLANEIDHAHTFAINNQYAVAVPMYREILTNLESMNPDDRDVGRMTAQTLAYLSNGLSWDDRQAEAESENAKAVALAEKLSTRFPKDPEVQKTVFSVFLLASSTHEGIKNDVSLAFAKRASEVAENAVSIDPADLQARFLAAKSLSRLGITLALNKQIDNAITKLNEAEKALNALIEIEPRNTIYLDDLGTLYIRFGDVEKSRGDLRATLAAYKKAVEVCERMVAIDVRNLVAHRDLAQALKSVGVTENKLDMKAEARASLGRASAIVKMLREQNALGKWDDKIFTEMDQLLASI